MGDRYINGRSESMALRSAYLLGDGVCSAGNSYGTITYDSFFKTMRIEDKVRHIEKRSPDEFKSMGVSAEQFIQMLKLHKKLKHPTPQQIIAHKKMVNALETLWKLDHQDALNRMMTTGLPQLAPLTETDELNMLGADNNNPERDDFDSFPLSKSLTLDFGENANNDIFFLTLEFMVDLFQQKLPVDRKPFFVEQVFTFPNLNVLNVDELRTVKANVKKEADPFRQKVNEWIKACNEKSPEQSRNLFYNELLPLTKPLNQKLEQDPILQHTGRLYTQKVEGYVVMGEMPLLTVWAFFLFNGVIPEATRKVLEEYSQKPEYQNRRVPFLANKFTENANDLTTEITTPEDNTTPPLPTRKTLDID
ncbi:MAG: hypothetical protein POELPBGB_03732 [Bacteroidia bacterium]|nr:hypothetical protein [Bacteroidia bacterium]